MNELDSNFKIVQYKNGEFEPQQKISKYDKNYGNNVNEWASFPAEGTVNLQIVPVRFGTREEAEKFLEKYQVNSVTFLK